LVSNQRGDFDCSVDRQVRMTSAAIKLAVRCAALLAVAISYGQGLGTQKSRKWIDSFSTYTS